MSLTHVHIRHHTKGKSTPGLGAKAVHYLRRTHQFAPEVKATVEYLDRRGTRVAHRDDLVAQGVVNFPAWAQDNPETFFEAAIQYEGANRRWATSWQCSLPVELSREQQRALIDTFLATHLPNRPTFWVLHDPVENGQHQPHIHVLFSERQVDGIDRPAAQMFKRYNRAQPARGGAYKDTFGEGDRQAPYRLREAWCASVNVALAQAGVEGAWLDPRSLKVRGVDREPVRYVYEENDEHKLEAKLVDERTPATRAQEAALAAEWWTEYQRAMGLTAAHLRDPQTVLTLIAREVREPGTRTRELHTMDAAREAGGRPALVDHVALDAPLIGNVRSKIYHAPGDPNYGEVQPKNQALFWSVEAAEGEGYRHAVNQHYGKGAEERLQADAAQLERRVRQVQAYGQRVAVEQRLAARGRGQGPAVETRLAALRREGHALGLGHGMWSDTEAPARGLRGPRPRTHDREDEYEW